nr:MAG: VP9a [Shelly headland virus]
MFGLFKEICLTTDNTIPEIPSGHPDIERGGKNFERQDWLLGRSLLLEYGPNIRAVFVGITSVDTKKHFCDGIGDPKRVLFVDENVYYDTPLRDSPSCLTWPEGCGIRLSDIQEAMKRAATHTDCVVLILETWVPNLIHDDGTTCSLSDVEGCLRGFGSAHALFFCTFGWESSRMFPLGRAYYLPFEDFTSSRFLMVVKDLPTLAFVTDDSALEPIRQCIMSYNVNIRARRIRGLNYDDVFYRMARVNAFGTSFARDNDAILQWAQDMKNRCDFGPHELHSVVKFGPGMFVESFEGYVSFGAMRSGTYCAPTRLQLEILCLGELRQRWRQADIERRVLFD